MSKYTTEELVKAIKRRSTSPSSQQLFKAEDYVDFANDELETNIVPLIMSVREEYFVGSIDVVVTPNLTTPFEFDIPADAIGQKLREICVVDTSNGNLTSIPRLAPEQASGSAFEIVASNGFIVRANKIVLYPAQSYAGQTLRVFYFKRPLTLVPLSKGAKITQVNTITNEIVVDKLPNTWIVGDTLTIVRSVQPFQTVVESVEITVLSSPTITLTSVSGIQVGDYVALEGYSCIPQVPVEAHKVLAQATAVKVLEALGDFEGMAAAEKKLNQNKEDMLKMINPRVDGAVKRITSNGNGLWDWNRATRRPY
jgi:hypothetical protein